MEFVVWNESYSVGDPLMDAHHRVFFEMVKEFSGQVQNADFDSIKRRIDFLVEYTNMHLASEERLMEKSGYPDLANHKAIHQAFAQKVLAARETFAKNPASASPQDILQLMQDWFVNHIMETDKGYTPYLNA